MTGSFSLDKVRLVAIVARLKKRSGDAVLRRAKTELTQRAVIGVRRMARRVSEKRGGDRIRAILVDSTAVKLRFGKENATRNAGVARREGTTPDGAAHAA